MSSKPATISGVLLLAALAVAASAEDGEDWTIERWQRAVAVEGLEGVDVVNESGDVRVRKIEGGEALLSAVIQSHPGDPYRAQIDVAVEELVLAVEVVWVPRDDSAGGRLTEEMLRRRVDLTILLPPGPELGIRTVDGLVEAKGVDNDVTAATRSGNVTVRTTGTVRAASEHGALDVTLSDPAWGASPELVTTTGDVTVWLPPGADAVVEAETEGILSTDYSLTVEPLPDGRRKRARAVIGDGTRSLTVRSGKGQIRLFRQFGVNHQEAQAQGLVR